MEREIISVSVASLPLSEIGSIQQDHEIWEEIDGGAKLMVTRHILPTPKRDEIISLSVSGVPSERQRVIREFAKVFGEPIDASLHLESLEHVDMVTWLNKFS